ncbi:MAG: hypothetical protein NZ739_09560 [Verrucomicrobiae bacterium]|nr:hypothetical protein [Verrucomicrobiae bacterium]MCX7723217.1 hypothetical protein [Verrucomicrobiae bacterium]MDW7979475.1 hypothetical protein [Verrucomicrobiales bacterium]
MTYGTWQSNYTASVLYRVHGTHGLGNVQCRVAGLCLSWRDTFLAGQGRGHEDNLPPEFGS